MEPLLCIIFILWFSALFYYKQDLIDYKKSILEDRFFLVLISAPVASSFFLVLPIISKTQLCFSAECYDNFIEYFKLPIGIIGVTSTIGAAYGFIYTSKQKDVEIKQINILYQIEKTEAAMTRLLAHGNSAKTLILVLKRVADHVGSIMHSIKAEIPSNKDTIFMDVEIIKSHWSSLYLDSRYMPAITSAYQYFSTINAGIRDLQLWAPDKANLTSDDIGKFTIICDELLGLISNCLEAAEKYHDENRQYFIKKESSLVALELQLDHMRSV
jgi:hypothetical protein